MIRPPPSRPLMCRAACLAHRNGPFRFTSSAASHSSSRSSVTGPPVIDPGVVDEDVEPPVAGDRLAEQRLDVGLAAHVGADGDPLAARLPDRGEGLLEVVLRRGLVRRASRSGGPTSLATTLAPASAKRRAMSRPSPRAAPVTRTTRPPKSYETPAPPSVQDG